MKNLKAKRKLCINFQARLINSKVCWLILRPKSLYNWVDLMMIGRTDMMKFVKNMNKK